MNQYCLRLNLPVNLLKYPFNPKNYGGARHCLVDRGDISNGFIDLISTLGLTLVHVELFYSRPDTQYKIHRDNHNRLDFPKINWVWGGTGSRMLWYKTKNGASGTKLHTGVNSSYTLYDQFDVDRVLQSIEIPTPSIVQAGIPHRVETPIDRWAISTVYKDCTGSFLTWVDMADVFSEYIVDD